MASTQPDRCKCGNSSKQSPKYSVALPMRTGWGMGILRNLEVRGILKLSRTTPRAFGSGTQQ